MRNFASSPSRISGNLAPAGPWLCRSTPSSRRLAGAMIAAIALGTLLTPLATAADLSGFVTYKASGSQPVALPSALVSVYQTSTGRKVVTRTNSEGMFVFKNLSAGMYVILVEKDGRRVYQGKVETRDQDTRFDIGL